METRSRMSRSLHTNRDFEKLEPYEGKPSRTVLRGEEGSNALDLPDRPADMEQRNGRAVRKGNTVKLWGGNVVDIVIYGTEKTLDAYKFNLLRNKQMFINQINNGTIAVRRIDDLTIFIYCVSCLFYQIISVKFFPTEILSAVCQFISLFCYFRSFIYNICS